MLKKKLLILVLSIFVLFSLISPAIASAYEYYFYFKNIKLVIGHKEAEANGSPILMEQSAYVKNGRTLVPFRFLGESLGAEINWDGKTNQAILKLDKIEVKVTIGSKVAYVNNKLQTLDVPAELKGGRTFIPLRFVSESLGAWVTYEDETKTITVRYCDKSQWRTHKTDKYDLELLLPIDWSVKEEDGFIVISSPNNSKFYLSFVGESPEKIMQHIKEDYEKSGWKLEKETLYTTDTPKDGGELFFMKNDYINNTIEEYLVYIDTLGNDSSRVAEMYFDTDHTLMDNIVMLDILNNYTYIGE